MKKILSATLLATLFFGFTGICEGHGSVNIVELVKHADQYPTSDAERQRFAQFEPVHITSLNIPITGFNERYAGIEVWQAVAPKPINPDDAAFQINVDIFSTKTAAIAGQKQEVEIAQFVQKLKNQKQALINLTELFAIHLPQYIEAKSKKNLVKEAEIASKIIPGTINLLGQFMKSIQYYQAIAELHKKNECNLSDTQIQRLADETFAAIQMIATFHAYCL